MWPQTSRGSAQVYDFVGRQNPAAGVQPAAQTTPPTGTDLSLPVEIAKALSDALPDRRYRLEQAQTAKGRTNNLCFHRIVGRSDAGICSVALIYLDESRLSSYRDPCCVYSLSTRIRKVFQQSEHDRLGLVFLAPESTPFPDGWTQQVKDLEDLRMVSTARYQTVAPPPMWLQYSQQDTIREVEQWATNLGLRPLTDAPDTFGGAGGNTQLAGGGAATIVPNVFISYAHDDKKKWLTMVKETLGGYKQQCRIWTDEQIGASNEFDRMIKGTLESSPIAILLVSQRFAASEYIRSVELREALEGHQLNKKKILWLNVDITPEMNVQLPNELTKITAVTDLKFPLERLSPAKVAKVMSALKDDFGKCLSEMTARNAAAPTGWSSSGP